VSQSTQADYQSNLSLIQARHLIAVLQQQHLANTPLQIKPSAARVCSVKIK
jgi:hypothetical protein